MVLATRLVTYHGIENIRHLVITTKLQIPTPAGDQNKRDQKRQKKIEQIIAKMIKNPQKQNLFYAPFFSQFIFVL